MGYRLEVNKETASSEALYLLDGAQIISGVLSSAARHDTGAVTTTIPDGMSLGIVTATGKYVEHDDTKGDGTEVFAGILIKEETTLNPDTGLAADVVISILIGGFINQELVVANSDANLVVANAKTDMPGITWLTPESRYFAGTK